MAHHHSHATCSTCGDPVDFDFGTQEELASAVADFEADGGRCERCVEDVTMFDKLVNFQVAQWLGSRPISYRSVISSVLEPQNATYAAITFRDGTVAKVFRQGETDKPISDQVATILNAKLG